MGSLTRLALAAAAGLLVAARPVPAPAPTAQAAVVPAPPSIKAGVDKWRAGQWAEAVAIWTPFAASGEPNALFNMGQAYKLGRGVTADPAVARDYYRKAAAKGHLPAQANLGISLFQTGEKPEAVRWLRQAADRGDARAQYVLGIAAYNGDGLPRNPGLGYGYLLRSSASGLAQATTALGNIEPSLGPIERQAGTTIAASLAAGTGVPPALAAATGPRLITAPPAPGTTLLRTLPALPPPPLIKSPPPPAVPLSVTASSVLRPDVPDPGERHVAARTAPAATSVPPPATAGVSAVTVPAGAAGAPPAAVVTAPVPSTVAPRPAISKPVTVAAATELAAADVSPPKPAVANTDPAPAKPAKPSGWRVQLGAFSQRRLADEAWAAVQRGGAVGDSVKPVFATDGAVTKLQLGPYATREAARIACAKLSETGRACFVTVG